jgi:iron complex outermembrane receptor protein
LFACRFGEFFVPLQPTTIETQKQIGMRRTMIAALCGLAVSLAQAQITADSLALQEVVVTGTRNATDVRHLPMTVTVVGCDLLTAEHQPSVLPTVMREVPGLFVTSRSMMGYGVSTGAAGGINLRGITGGAGQLMVLIDGHPQY